MPSEPNQLAIESTHFDSIAPYQEQLKQVREAAKTVLEGFEKEVSLTDFFVFIRNTKGDHKEMWAVEVLMYMQALATLQKFADGKL